MLTVDTITGLTLWGLDRGMSYWLNARRFRLR